MTGAYFENVPVLQYPRNLYADKQLQLASKPMEPIVTLSHTKSLHAKLTNQDSLPIDSGGVFIESQSVCGELLRTTDTLH